MPPEFDGLKPTEFRNRLGATEIKGAGLVAWKPEVFTTPGIVKVVAITEWSRDRVGIFSFAAWPIEGMTDITPVRGRTAHVNAPMRTLRRFTKPGGHSAQICERTVTQVAALEFIVFVDGSLLESELFHHGREAQYPAALEARIKQFIDSGWTETSIDARPSQ